LAYAFVSPWNCSGELAARVAGGSPFMARAAATGDALSLRVERRANGICNVMV